MANATTASRLFRRLHLRAAPSERDLADCGTAFGLDLSMQREDPVVPPSPRATRDAGWWRRLAARRGPVNP